MNSSLSTVAHITNLKAVLISLLVAIAVAAVAISAHLTRSSPGNVQIASTQMQVGV